MKSAATSAEHFFDGTAEVDINHIEAVLDKFQGGRREIRWVGPHQLSARRVFVVGHMQEVPIPPPRLELDNEFVEHHFTQRVRCPKTPRNQPHRHIAVAR
mgnify:CR=1 FL=1